MASVRRIAPGLFEARLHRAFLSAPAEVLDEVAALLAGRRADRARILSFVEERLREAGPPLPPRRRPARSAGTGAAHDLAAYAGELNRLYLNGRSSAAVSWGRRGARRGSRSIRFACYDASRNLIIMNRKLDSPAIPRYFVEFVLFHEMLHEVLGIGEKADGRRDIHGRVFKLMETTFPDYDKALRFERELVRHLAEL